MKTNHSARAGSASFVLAAIILIWLSGCASRPKQSSETAQNQANASDRAVILVPVFIVSPQDNDALGNKQDSLPNGASPPEWSIQGQPAVSPPDPPTKL